MLQIDYEKADSECKIIIFVGKFIGIIENGARSSGYQEIKFCLSIGR